MRLRLLPLLLLVAVAASGRGLAEVSAPAGASGAGGDVVITGAYVGDDGAAGYRPVYLTIHNAGRQADLLEAVIAPAARSATWAVAHKVHTVAEVEAFSEPCGADLRLLRASTAALASAGDVFVPAGGTVALAPGAGRISLNGIGPLVRGGPPVEVTLYFVSGAQINLQVPVDGPRQLDSLAN